MTALARLSLRYRTVTLLVVALLLGAGTWSVGQLNQELFPSIDIPNLLIVAVEPGAGPNAVADGVGKPIEDIVRSTQGLKHVTTTALEGVAIISAEYEFGTDMTSREREVREKMGTLALPEGARTPTVQRISVDAFPIFSVAVSGDDEVALEAFVTDELAPAIDQLEGVGNLSIAGGTTRVVSVVIDPSGLAAAGVSPVDIMTALRSAQIAVPAGGVSAEGALLPVRVVTTANDVEAVEALLIPTRVPGAPPVRLGDVALVAIAEGGAGSTVSRLDGHPAITLEVTKTQGVNTVETVDAIEDAIAGLDIPDGVEIAEVINQAPEIRKSVNDLARDALIGGVLAILMILAFLRSFRGTLVSGVSIPLSLLVAFMLMRAGNISLNILTLGALSVAVGRVIDDAIVVLENIHRLLDAGYERSEAVLKGTSQMVPAITASTITTVAVFLPLAFVGGLVGEVFVGFALTVTFALAASLFVAVTVVPVLAMTFLKPASSAAEVAAELGHSDTGLKRAYARPLTWAIKHAWTTAFIAVLLFGGSVYSLTALPIALFPSGSTTTLELSLTGLPGTSLETMSATVSEVESGIAELEGVERFSTVVGTSTDNPLAAILSGGGGSNSASITIDLAEDADADALAASVEDLGTAARLRVAVTKQSGGTAPPLGDLSIQVTGRVFEDVATATDLVVEGVDGMEGIDDVSSNIAGDRPELIVDVNQEKAVSVGLDAATVAGIVRAALTPTPVTRMDVGGEKLDVVLVTNPAAVAGPEALASLPLGPGVRLGQVADITQGASPTAVTRFDGNRSAEVTGVITDENAGAVNQKIEDMISGLDLPEGVDASLAGVAEQQQESFSSLGVAMIIAVALVYLSMVATFGSLMTPFVILLTLPLATVGAFPALLVTGRLLDLTAMLGLLMLIGIVVTNGIVMLEFVDRLRKEEGMSVSDALLVGAQTRLRPILMTAIVTMLALSPLAIGLSDGGVLSASLATVVIGGLFSSTLLTLFVLPAAYTIVSRIQARFSR